MDMQGIFSSYVVLGLGLGRRAPAAELAHRAVDGERLGEALVRDAVAPLVRHLGAVGGVPALGVGRFVAVGQAGQAAHVVGVLGVVDGLLAGVEGGGHDGAGESGAEGGVGCGRGAYVALLDRLVLGVGALVADFFGRHYGRVRLKDGLWVIREKRFRMS